MKSCVALATLVSSVVAHGGVLSYSWSGNTYQGWLPYNSPVGQTTIQREWDTYNPIQDVTLSTLACNDDGSSGALQLTANIAAGTAVTAYWNQVWPHNTGPMLTYLASCGAGSCNGVNATTLSWFKIQQAGLLSGSIGSGLWAAGQMIAQNSSWTTVIPTTVPSGNYLLRFETIALHSMPAQNYPECAQINITGGGKLAPTAAQLVKFPGGYVQTDPGLTIDIYSQTANSTFTYVIPGPPLYGSATTASTTTTKPATTSASSSAKPPATTSVPPASTAPPSTGTAAKYGQCGGIGWTGPTVCAAGSTCTVSNAYYSQCL